MEKLVRKRTAERPVAGFNLVVVKGREGMCLQYDGGLRPAFFGPGAHVVSTDHDLDDPRLPEKKAFDDFLSGLSGVPEERDLARFLASHEGDRPVCKHGDAAGTLSSTIYTRGLAGERLRYADGPPCRTAFRDCSDLLRWGKE